MVSLLNVLEIDIIKMIPIPSIHINDKSQSDDIQDEPACTQFWIETDLFGLIYCFQRQQVILIRPQGNILASDER